MSSSVNSHALIAAFSFGIVANVASNSIVLFAKGYGTPLLRHVQRLLLVIFLAAAGLWAFIDFVVMTTQSTPTCQVALGFAAAFDQLARVAFQQFLLWAAVHGPRLSLGTCVPQAVIVLRFVLGGVFVGLQRPQLQPVCLSYTLLLPLGITVVAVDGALALAFLVKVNWGGRSGIALDKDSDLSRDKKLMLTIIAFGAWTALSSPMILGIRSLHLALRTVLPAVGLLILISVLLLCRTSLVLESGQGPIFTPDGSPPRPRQVSVAVPEVTGPGGFASLPPNVPELPPGPSFTSKNMTTVTSGSAAKQLPKLDKQLPIISQPGPGPSTVGVGGLPVAGQLFPPMRAEPQPDMNRAPPLVVEPSSSRKRFDRSGKNKISNVSNLVISNPVLDETSPQNPLNKIATVDLEVARRRAQHPQPLRSHSIAVRSGTELPVPTVEDVSVPQAADVPPPGADQVPAVTLEPIRESHWTASTTSAQPSPGIDEMRRRSPRQSIPPVLDQMPPPPPLKTPRTVAKSLPPPRQQTAQSQPDTLNLLSVPQPRTRPPATASSSTMARSTSVRSRPATALSLGTMSTSTGPATKVGQRSRGQSLSSRRSRSNDATHDVVFTDPRTPPPIPKTVNEGSPEERKTEDTNTVGESRQSPPPPYKANGSKTPRTSLAAPPYNMPHVGASLSLFPPAQSSPVPRPPTRTRVPSVSGTPPRSRDGARRSTVDDRRKVQELSIMLLKEIEYSQPIDVNEIVEQYLGKKPPSSPSTVILESVLNRPRPIPRTPEAGHFLQLFKGEPRSLLTPQVQRRRSLSCSSVKTRKSLLPNIPESPVALPALPPLSQYEGEGMRPFLRDAKSMTFDEKVAMFFPASPSTRSGMTRVSRRRSSSLFEITSSGQVDKIIASQPVSGDDELDKRSSRSSATTVRTHSLFNIPDKPMSLNLQPTRLSSINPSQYTMPSARQSRAPSEEAPRSLMDIKRQSSPVLPAADLETPSSLNDYEDDDAEGTLMMMNGESLVRRESLESTSRTIVPKEAEQRELSPASMETATPDRQSLADAGEFQILSAPVQTPVASGMDRFHRRIGEECPTFSNREGVAKPRKLPPPTPLALSTSLIRPILVAAEPSPLESPTQALRLIEDQLKRLEQSDQQSAVTEHQRKTLIANLEMEMDLQESQWQMMRRDTIRDSLSTVTVTPSVDAMDSLRLSGLPRLDKYSVRSSLAESRKSTNLLEASHRLENLDMNRRSMLSNAGSRVSFLTVSRSAGQIGSPTPPDTDESDHEEGSMEIPMVLDHIIDIGMDMEMGMGMEMRAVPSLWRVNVPSPVMIASCPKLWSPTLERAADPWFGTYLGSQKPDGKPSFRKFTTTPLEVETSRLWKPESSTKPRSPSIDGLWMPSSTTAGAEAISDTAPSVIDAGVVVANPKTTPALVRRPSRKSKRITELPDIPESPQPLPDKRGTLGIFQFPWGEISDTATAPGPAYTFPAMPGTMTSGHSLVNSFFLAQGQQQSMPKRANSYFDEEMDEMDDEDAGDNFSDTDSSDEFDESTLWEIASLLQSNQVPSRQSLLPGQWFGGRGDLNRQYLEADSPASPSSPLPPCEELVPLFLDDSVPIPRAPRVKKPKSTLWEAKSQFYRATVKVGLPEPTRTAWASYTAALGGGGFEPKRSGWSAAPVAVSGSLWSKPRSAAVPDLTMDFGLWCSGSAPGLTAARMLWTAIARPYKPTVAVGLPQPAPPVWSSYTASVGDYLKPRRTPWLTSASVVSGYLWSKSDVSICFSPTSRRPSLWSSRQCNSTASQTLWRPALLSTTPTSLSNGPRHFDGLWSTPPHHITRDGSPSIVQISFTKEIAPQQQYTRRPAIIPAPQIISSNLWTHSDALGRTPAPPNWTRTNIRLPDNFSANETSSSIAQRKRRRAATEADWADALAEAMSASSTRSSYPALTSGNFLWSSLSRQRQGRAARHVPSLTTIPHLWQPSLVVNEPIDLEDKMIGESSSLDLALRHMRTRSCDTDDASDVASITSRDDFIGQGLWSRVEAASRTSRLMKRTDWIVRCGA